MEKLTSRFKRSRSKTMSSSLDFLNLRGLFDDREESRLKWLTFSSIPVGILPVYLATTACETESLGRATSSISVSTPTDLNRSMESATLPRSFQLLTVPGAVPECPFRATALWENSVFHLENSVKPGRHTRGLGIYENCFRGAQAVACLSTYLNAVLPKTVSRGQVLTLCQKLVATGVMEDVKDKERTMFKEGRLYRFSKEHFWQQPAGGSAAELDSIPSPSLFECQSPTLHSTPIERHKTENISRTPLAVSSVKYPSDSTIAVSSHTKHCLFHRQSSYKPHSGFKRRNTKAGQTLKKAKSLMLHQQTNKFGSEPPCEHSDRGNAKLSRRNAIRKRVSRPLKLAKTRDHQAFTKGKDQRGVYRAMAPAQQSQSQSYRVKDAITHTPQRRFTGKTYSQTEKEDMARIKGNSSKWGKRVTVKENDHVVKSYCIDTSLRHTVANKPKLFNACVNPVSSVREDTQTSAPAPAGMNWVVYGYL